MILALQILSTLLHSAHSRLWPVSIHDLEDMELNQVGWWQFKPWWQQQVSAVWPWCFAWGDIRAPGGASCSVVEENTFPLLIYSWRRVTAGSVFMSQCMRHKHDVDTETAFRSSPLTPTLMKVFSGDRTKCDGKTLLIFCFLFSWMMMNELMVQLQGKIVSEQWSTAFRHRFIILSTEICVWSQTWWWSGRQIRKFLCSLEDLLTNWCLLSH